VSLAVGGNTVEVQVRVRRETLRLLVVEGGVRIAPGEPAPRTVLMVRLATVDDDVGDVSAQLLHQAPPAPPLRVAARAVERQEGVVERVSRNSGAVVKSHGLFDEPILQCAIPEAPRLPARIAA